MRRKNRLMRLFRALSEETQRDFGETTGIHPVLMAKYEMDKVDPGSDHVELAARGAGLTVAAGEQLLRQADTLARPRRRSGLGAKDLSSRLSEVVSEVYQRLLRLPLPEAVPRPEDRQGAAGLWTLLQDLPEEHQLAVVRVAREFQIWPLVELACEESAVQASRDCERAAGLARLAQEIAERVHGPEGWRRRVRGLAAAHGPNVLRVRGELKAADAAFEEAKHLWHSGSDPGELLDSGRLLDLEASLRRDQRRFGEALARLDEALSVGRCPERYLIKKGFTLDVMGEYEKAVEALLQAQPLVEERGDARLANILSHNLALTFTHLGRYSEAAEVGRRVHAVAVEMGDTIGILRGIWLEGHIASGLGQRAEALRLLAQARTEFDKRDMSYDVALALLEEAVLLLEEGRTAEVQGLAKELEKVFESKGVHREALAALRLFHEAAVREEATAELGRRVLRFLFRARHDEGLQFEL
ncbi:MAG TPA: hypothetical protein VF173_05830 [Thermoanaerobaculia bacterium]|nr:hypothetical protein [Thermoanaerobaculia bacterium]